MDFTSYKKTLSLAGFVFVILLFLSIAVLYIYNIIIWFNYPDFGFNVRFAMGSLVVSDVSERGRTAGLKSGDRIFNVNGSDIQRFETLRTLINRGIGEKNTYLIKRNGKQDQITITNLPLGFKKVFSQTGFNFLFGLCYFLMGVIIFLMKPHDTTSWIYFAQSATFGIFFMFLHPIGVMRPSGLESSMLFAYAFIPAFLIHLALSFPEKRRILTKNPWLPAMFYAVSTLLFLSFRSVTGQISDIPPLFYTLIVFYMAVSILWFLGSCLQLWRFSPSQIVKMRSKMILLGWAIASTPPLTDLVYATFYHRYIVPNPNYYLPFFLCFPLFLGYTIFKYDLFDFDIIIKRTYGYIITTGTIAGFYGLFILISNLAFGRFGFAQSPLFPLMFILAVVFLFNPVRNRLQQFINRVFYRLEYDYEETIKGISESMRSLMKLEEIAQSIIETALGTMFIDCGCVLLLDQEKQHCDCIIAAGESEQHRTKEKPGYALPNEKTNCISGSEKYASSIYEQKNRPENGFFLEDLEIPMNDPLIRNLSRRKKEVTLYDIQEDPFFKSDRDACLKTMETLQAALIVPLLYEDHLTGLISLGVKKSGKFYQREDINLLTTLANQGVVAIENALLLEEMIEKERMKEELAIAHDLQTSMMPDRIPELAGFEISAQSLSAREVGGDFYDFFIMNDNRLGFVIGDVTGKSVSGALVMAASRSVFRMLSQEEQTVGETMIKANKRIKEDITSGMFVALLYGIIDSDHLSLSFSSAGQTLPIHYSAKSGTARLMDIEGDTFPLGILDDADYQENQLLLESDDVVVFYTDGIVEAMNEDKEIFGFDRLIDIVQQSGKESAQGLLFEIMEKTTDFAGKALQHDDLTLIVVKVKPIVV